MKRTLTSIAIMLTMTGMAQVFRRPANPQKDQGTYGVTARFGLDTSSYLYMVDTISIDGAGWVHMHLIGRTETLDAWSIGAPFNIFRKGSPEFEIATRVDDVQKVLDSLRSAKPIVQDELISKCDCRFNYPRPKKKRTRTQTIQTN